MTLFPKLWSYPRPLEPGLFLERRKRFFVDVQRPDGTAEAVHCANSGSMKSCLVPGAPLWTLDSHDPKRQLRHTLEILELEDGLACLNTQRANGLVAAWLSHTLPSGTHIKREARFNESTRFDFCLEFADLPTGSAPICWVEVKSVSLRQEDGSYAFPDAVTTRGLKHLDSLQQAVQQGHDAWLIFAMMRGSKLPVQDILSNFSPANRIDPAYAAGLERAQAAGVRVTLLGVDVGLEGLGVRGVKEYRKGNEI